MYPSATNGIARREKWYSYHFELETVGLNSFKNHDVFWFFFAQTQPSFVLNFWHRNWILAMCYRRNSELHAPTCFFTFNSSVGDPKYRIPKLEPLTISKMRIEQGTKQVGMTMECQECNLYGLSEVNFTAARYDYPSSVTNFSQTV